MFWSIDNKTLHIKKKFLTSFLKGFWNRTKNSAQQKMLLNVVLPERHFKTMEAPQENKRK